MIDITDFKIANIVEDDSSTYVYLNIAGCGKQIYDYELRTTLYKRLRDYIDIAEGRISLWRNTNDTSDDIMACIRILDGDIKAKLLEIKLLF